MHQAHARSKSWANILIDDIEILVTELGSAAGHKAGTFASAGMA